MNKRSRFPLLHLTMFVITFFTTLLAGALQRGINPIDTPGEIGKGLPFALALMCILLAHEFSHYFASKVHGVKATLPLFIPAPPPVIFGTFGAFIKMKSPIFSQNALIDIGASGPIGGFIIAVLASIIGLAFSEVVPVTAVSGGLYLGDSILFNFLSHLIVGNIPEGHDVFLHPVAFAGWIGFFVTSLNLLPIGQLDGGHIAFAFLGRKHRTFSIVLISLLIILGTFYWPGWLIWAVLLIILGIDHPPVLSRDIRFTRKRRYIGPLCLLIFILTFTPVPFSLDF